MNPRLREADILTLRAGRYRYAQPICPPGFLDRLPPVDPGVRGLLVADTSHCYPEDRSVHESVKLGAGLARALRC
jgi:protoporphyrinogen oxidase